MPTMAVWMPETAVQISPPLKFCGVCVSRAHISDSLPFQSVRALSRMLTIQLSLIETHLHRELRPTMRRNSLFCSGPAHTTPMTDKISFAKAIIKPPNRQRKPWVRWLASWD